MGREGQHLLAERLPAVGCEHRLGVGITALSGDGRVPEATPPPLRLSFLIWNMEIIAKPV